MHLIVAGVISHAYSKEHRFLLSPTQPLVGVVGEIRRQIGLKEDSIFNLKWLDVEGRPTLLSLIIYLNSEEVQQPCAFGLGCHVINS